MSRPNGERRIFRYTVPVDDRPHAVPLSSSRDPVAVAATGDSSLVEFWCEHAEGALLTKRVFQVFGTGHVLPEGARWVGTCARTGPGLVWHLYEVTP